MALIHFGQFIDGRSFGHRLDARVKILSVVLLSVLVLQAQGGEALLLTAFLALIVPLSKVRFRLVLEALRPLWFFAALLFGLHLFFTEGTPLLRLPLVPLTITDEGLVRGSLVAWQFLILASWGALLSMTTAPTDLVFGLERLLRPLKRLRVPTQDIAVMVSLALRFVPTLQEEYERIRTAQAARGADLGTGTLVAKCKALVALVVPLLFSALRRADELADAMEARGYAGGERTTLHRPRFGPDEWKALSSLSLLVLAIVIGRVCL
ncbi:MAG: energy-coupling factor transporter transmembrane component T [Deltaproteobacteria bacterium]|nr:energy-coupling factor transporter transmembrane component T [Deltaproteobacteria bacterium]